MLEALALLDDLGARQTGQRLRRQFRAGVTCMCPAARPGPRPPTRLGSPAGRSRCSSCWPRGLGNAEVAARLSLSPKTVEHHVSALLAKLDVSSRRQVAAAARQLGVVPAKDEGAGRPELGMAPRSVRPWGVLALPDRPRPPGSRTGGTPWTSPPARRFCQVTGIDYVPALLDRARQRATAEGLEATFQEADAEDLPFPDAAFDAGGRPP